MATLFVRHNVKDYTAWREAYDAFDGERRAMGVTSYGVYQLDGNPNDVTFYHEFATMDSAAAFAASPRLREVMQAAGADSQPDIWYTNRT